MGRLVQQLWSAVGLDGELAFRRLKRGDKVREILFKAKGRDNGEWVEGYYVLCRKCHYILPIFNSDALYHGYDERYDEWIEIEPSTICQYTGLTDKKGKKIYEGDIIAFEDVGEEGYEYKEGFDFINRAVIIWNNGRFELDKLASNNSGVLEDMNCCHEDFWNDLKDCEVIGNIFDNPDLLNQQN